MKEQQEFLRVEEECLAGAAAEQKDEDPSMQGHAHTLQVPPAEGLEGT